MNSSLPIRYDPVTYRAPATLVHPLAKSPSGTLTVLILHGQPCDGAQDAIELCYQIPPGTQKSFHPSPQTMYPSTERIAYLPHSAAGHALVKRMIWAFGRGFTFSVGRSQTSHQDNVVVWSGHVPHKTRLNGGGQFAWPDANYIATCHRALDKLQVPAQPSTIAAAAAPAAATGLPDASLQYQALDTLPNSQSLACSPSGAMVCKILSQQPLPGFNATPDSIEICYTLPAGVQKSFHQNPGVNHAGCTRFAYLPDNQEGRDLLRRLQYAFLQGYTFNVGTSMSSGRNNVVVWSGLVPHKTDISGRGGSFGYPDANYITNCNANLDSLQVPPANQIGQLSTTTAPVAIMPPPPPAAAAQGRSFSSYLGSMFQRSGASRNSGADEEQIFYDAPESMTTKSALTDSGAIVEYSAGGDCKPAANTDSKPPAANGATTDDSECVICLGHLDDPNAGRAVQVKACGHVFHANCLERWLLGHDPTCPTCRTAVGGAPQGKSPSGILTIRSLPNIVCPGFNGCPTLELTYDIPSGTQRAYHETPGQSFFGTTRVAFLPDNQEGTALLARLKYAWTHGLTFQVGTSLTTGRTNQVTWTSIHHKTSLQGGPHGFPDANYVTNTNQSLDALGVPNAEVCKMSK